MRSFWTFRHRTGPDRAGATDGPVGSSRTGELDGAGPSEPDRAGPGRPGLVERRARRAPRRRWNARRFWIAEGVVVLAAAAALLINVVGARQVGRHVQGLVPAFPATPDPGGDWPQLRPMTSRQLAVLVSSPDPTGSPAEIGAQFVYDLQVGDEAAAASMLVSAQRHALAGRSADDADEVFQVVRSALGIDEATGFCPVPITNETGPASGWTPQSQTVLVPCPGHPVRITVVIGEHGPAGVNADPHLLAGVASTSAGLSA